MMADDKVEIPMSVTIDGNMVNEYVAKAILESALGAQLQTAMNKILSSTGSYARDDVFTEVIKEAIRTHVQNLLVSNSEMVDLIRERIKVQVIEKMTDEVIDKLVDRAFNDRHY